MEGGNAIYSCNSTNFRKICLPSGRDVRPELDPEGLSQNRINPVVGSGEDETSRNEPEAAESGRRRDVGPERAHDGSHRVYSSEL